MDFTPEQKEAIEIRHTNVVVSASAGSGKTRVLVERLCRLVIDDKIPIDAVLAMTFTNDAAAEMKSRLRGRLNAEPQTDYIRRQVAALETASICTIDSFCRQIVTNYYYQIPISYTMAQQTASDAQRKEAFDRGYQAALSHVQPDHLLWYAHRFKMDSTAMQDIVAKTIDAAWAKADPKDWFEQIKNDAFHQAMETWFFRGFKDRINALLDYCRQGEAYADIFTQKIQALAPCLDACRQQDYPAFYQAFRVYMETTGYYRVPKEYKNELEPIKDSSRELEKEITKRLLPEEIYQTDHQQEQEIIHEFCDLCLETKQQYNAIKKEMEIIDFGDMESFAYELLKQPAIRQEVSEKYQAILIDEFQDTNDLQESIIRLIAHPDNVFRVGDIKQSIYGFRQARPDIMRQYMRSSANKTLVMDQNFRSNANIVAFNNDFYRKIMNTELLGSQFESIDEARPGLSAQSETPQIPIRFLYLDQTDSDAKEKNPMSPRQMRMDVIAADIARKHREQGIPYRDICILTRSHSPQQDLLKTMAAFQIPAVADLNQGFYSNSAVQIVLAVLESLYYPHHDIALTAALLSPIGGVDNETLAKACIDKPKGSSLYNHIKNFDFMENWNALRACRYEPTVDVLKAIYTAGDFYQTKITRQERTNLDALLEKAADQDDAALFTEQLRQDAGQDAAADAYAYGKNDDVVQIKTMHHSKGLQFPVVYILSQSKMSSAGSSPIRMDADLGISLHGLNAAGTVKRTSFSEEALKTKALHDQLQEEMRVFYVATTRAQKELVFVDAIRDPDQYALPFGTAALLENSGYTGWLFHTYFNDPNSPVQFQRVVCDGTRPALEPETAAPISAKTYDHVIHRFGNATASGTKVKREWQPLQLEKNQATIRGDLFHEAMADPYPYQKADLMKTASRYHFELSQTDMRQLLQLNEQPMYQEWMTKPHRFECPYACKDGERLVHGFMDLVVFDTDEIIILDYKTDHVENAQELISRYRAQLDTYRKAMQSLQDKPVRTYLYSFHLDALIPLS